MRPWNREENLARCRREGEKERDRGDIKWRRTPQNRWGTRRRVDWPKRNLPRELILQWNHLYTTLTCNLLSVSWPRFSAPPPPLLPPPLFFYVIFIYRHFLLYFSLVCFLFFLFNSHYINGLPREHGCPWRQAYCLFRLSLLMLCFPILHRQLYLLPLTFASSYMKPWMYFQIACLELSANLTRFRNGSDI